MVWIKGNWQFSELSTEPWMLTAYRRCWAHPAERYTKALERDRPHLTSEIDILGKSRVQDRNACTMSESRFNPFAPGVG